MKHIDQKETEKKTTNLAFILQWTDKAIELFNALTKTKKTFFFEVNLAESSGSATIQITFQLDIPFQDLLFFTLYRR